MFYHLAFDNGDMKLWKTTNLLKDNDSVGWAKIIVERWPKHISILTIMVTLMGQRRDMTLIKEETMILILFKFNILWVIFVT